MTVNIIFHGHSTFQIDVDETSILIDPFFTENPATTVCADALSSDVILVSHGHGDHVADLVEIARRTGALVISNYEICEWLKSQDVTNVHAQNTGGAYQHPFGTIKQTIAHHSSVLPDGTYGGSPNGFLIKLEGGNIYFTGDTSLFLDMQLYGDEIVDVAILPIGDNFTMGPDDAVRATQLIKPRHVIPCHYNTWELIHQDANDWAEQVKNQTESIPIILQPGESWTL